MPRIILIRKRNNTKKKAMGVVVLHFNLLQWNLQIISSNLVSILIPNHHS